jgi:hypothetical protein
MGNRSFAEFGGAFDNTLFNIHRNRLNKRWVLIAPDTLWRGIIDDAIKNCETIDAQKPNKPLCDILYEGFWAAIKPHLVPADEYDAAQEKRAAMETNWAA